MARKPMTTAEYAERLKAINPNFELLTEYNRSTMPVRVLCHRCNTKFDRTPEHFHSRKHCPTCSGTIKQKKVDPVIAQGILPTFAAWTGLYSNEFTFEKTDVELTWTCRSCKVVGKLSTGSTPRLHKCKKSSGHLVADPIVRTKTVTPTGRVLPILKPAKDAAIDMTNIQKRGNSYRVTQMRQGIKLVYVCTTSLTQAVRIRDAMRKGDALKPVECYLYLSAPNKKGTRFAGTYRNVSDAEAVRDEYKRTGIFPEYGTVYDPDMNHIHIPASCKHRLHFKKNADGFDWSRNFDSLEEAKRVRDDFLIRGIPLPSAGQYHDFNKNQGLPARTLSWSKKNKKYYLNKAVCGIGGGFRELAHAVQAAKKALGLQTSGVGESNPKPAPQPVPVPPIPAIPPVPTIPAIPPVPAIPAIPAIPPIPSLWGRALPPLVSGRMLAKKL